MAGWVVGAKAASPGPSKDKGSPGWFVNRGLQEAHTDQAEVGRAGGTCGYVELSESVTPEGPCAVVAGSRATGR